jgi:hypothetical protein
MSAGLPYGLQAMLKVRRLLLLVPHIFFFSLSLSLNARRRRVVFIIIIIIIIIVFVCVRVLVQSQRRLDDVDEMSFAR